MRRCNCCIFNHPCPICCPCSLACTGNEVINPILENDFGFFNNTASSTVCSQSVIPVHFVEGEGFSISGQYGTVRLAAGTYEVSYLAGGTVPINGSMSIKLRLNGVDVSGSVLTGNQNPGDFINLSQTMVISVSQNSTLELVNNSVYTTIFAYASMFIKRL